MMTELSPQSVMEVTRSVVKVFNTVRFVETIVPARRINRIYPGRDAGDTTIVLNVATCTGPGLQGKEMVDTIVGQFKKLGIEALIEKHKAQPLRVIAFMQRSIHVEDGQIEFYIGVTEDVVQDG